MIATYLSFLALFSMVIVVFTPVKQLINGFLYSTHRTIIFPLDQAKKKYLVAILDFKLVQQDLKKEKDYDKMILLSQSFSSIKDQKILAWFEHYRSSLQELKKMHCQDRQSVTSNILNRALFQSVQNLTQYMIRDIRDDRIIKKSLSKLKGFY